MARITIEDCKIIPSRFELVVLASQRAKEIASGAIITVERDNDKNPVVALREIAAGNVTLEGMRELFIRKMQKRNYADDHKFEENESNVHKEVVEEIKTLMEDDLAKDIFSEESIEG